MYVLATYIDSSALMYVNDEIKMLVMRMVIKTTKLDNFLLLRTRLDNTTSNRTH